MTSHLPILAVDVLGSLAMVVLAFLSLYKAKVLRDMDPDNAVFLYLLWICAGLVGFAVSRALSHILRQFLILSGSTEIWSSINPYTGTINTLSFMAVGLVTFFSVRAGRLMKKSFLQNKNRKRPV
jgi:hypothetical protein